MKSKRGAIEFSYNQILMLIMLLVGAGVIFYFIYATSPFYTKTFDREACRGSVAIKAGVEKSTFISEILKFTPPLKCATKNACLSTGGKCPTGYDAVKVSGEEEVKKKIAGLMYDCWYQMGEGELDFVEEELFHQNVCVVCSRVQFSDEARKDIKEVKGLSKYLGENNVTGTGFTYLQHFSKNPKAQFLGSDQTLSLDKEYAIVYTVYSKEFLFNTFGTGAGGIIGGAGAGAVVGSFAGPIGTTVGVIIGGAAGAWGGSEAVKALESTIKKNKVFALSLVEYNAQEVAKKCTQIEGI